MTPNEEYQEIFDSHFIESGWKAFDAARKAAQAEWDEAVAAERARVKPRAKSRGSKKVELPDEFYESLRRQLYAKHRIEELQKGLDDLRDARDKQLDDLAPSVVFSPDPGAYWLADTSSDWAYSTQTQSSTYARGALGPLEYRLRAVGLDVHVQRRLESRRYDLWVNAPDWMIDAAKRTITIKDALTAYNRHGVNCRVYMPFLPYSINQYSREFGWGA